MQVSQMMFFVTPCAWININSCWEGGMGEKKRNFVLSAHFTRICCLNLRIFYTFHILNSETEKELLRTKYRRQILFGYFGVASLFRKKSRFFYFFILISNFKFRKICKYIYVSLNLVDIFFECWEAGRFLIFAHFCPWDLERSFLQSIHFS